MDLIRLRVFALTAVLTVAGIAVNARENGMASGHSQRWLEDHTVVTAGPFWTEPGIDGTRETYRMDPQTVQILSTTGLVTRVMTDGLHRYDVVVVGSDRGESFHDPPYCLRVQGWNPDHQRVASVSSNLGQLPVQFLDIKGPDGITRPAAFCFRLRDKVLATQTGIIGSMMLAQFRSGKSQDAYMYRFIDLDASPSLERLTAFIRQYLEAAVREP